MMRPITLGIRRIDNKDALNEDTDERASQALGVKKAVGRVSMRMARTKNSNTARGRKDCQCYIGEEGSRKESAKECTSVYPNLLSLM